MMRATKKHRTYDFWQVQGNCLDHLPDPAADRFSAFDTRSSAHGCLSWVFFQENEPPKNFGWGRLVWKADIVPNVSESFGADAKLLVEPFLLLDIEEAMVQRLCGDSSQIGTNIRESSLVAWSHWLCRASMSLAGCDHHDVAV